MTLHFEYETDIKLELDYETIISRVVEKSLDFEDCPYEVELNVILTDNHEIQKINKEFRDVDAPTDVLSFPLVDYQVPSDFSGLEEEADSYFNPETGELLLGDIIVSVEKVMGQAEEYGHSRERELGFLIAHSMLHLFGYDHMEEQERAVMEERQRLILDSLGITREN